MIPEGILDEHILAAIEMINRDGVPWSRQSVYYDLVINGSKYPPKLVISRAYEAKTGQSYSPHKFSSVEAKNHFLSRGYTVIDRRDEASRVIVDEDDESSFAEGATNYRTHRSYERDSKISRKAKVKRFAETGRLECEVCGFDFFATYGEIGLGYIEAHHRIPVSQLGAKQKTKIADLALVCSNCHRILHRYNTGKTVEELRTIINKT